MCVKVTTEYANGGLDNDDKDFFKQVFLDDEHKSKNKIGLVRNPSAENYIITRPEAVTLKYLLRTIISVPQVVFKASHLALSLTTPY